MAFIYKYASKAQREKEIHSHTAHLIPREKERERDPKPQRYFSQLQVQSIFSCWSLFTAITTHPSAWMERNHLFQLLVAA